MLKALLIGGLIALAASATLYTDETNGPDETQECLYQTEMWGSEDGTKFYFCQSGTNTVIERKCKTNTFFVRNETVCGCIPLALLNPNCVNAVATTISCTGDNLNQPQPAQNPNQFYLCPQADATAALLTCPEGKAFIKQDGYLGCFDWTVWRSLRNCPQ